MSNKKLKIVSFGNPVLRQKAKPVTVFHKKLHSLIDSIADTLAAEENSAALAANQVDILKRIVVIDYLNEHIELINPEIFESSGSQTDYEGCLSFPGYIGKVSRANFVKVKYFDRFGEEHIIEREEKLARCLQHEIDHLNGILYIDHVEEEYLHHAETDEKISLDEVRELTLVKKKAR
jgi:peptide deformylase